jgi:hypothetical protein
MRLVSCAGAVGILFGSVLGAASQTMVPGGEGLCGRDRRNYDFLVGACQRNPSAWVASDTMRNVNENRREVMYCRNLATWARLCRY